MKRIERYFWAIAAVLAAGLVHGEMFKDGETVCFLGDSITNGGRYQRVIQNYYLTRFPDQTIHFVNSGRSGDTAGGVLRSRFKEDVVDVKPTSVAVMFGMNDVGRGNYVENPDEKRLAWQESSLKNYSKNMETLTARIRAEAGDPKLYLMTPSPFDQTALIERQNQPGCNDGLGRCAEIVRELATKNNATLVEFHIPMTAFNLEQQKKDPKYTIIGRDRVHPGAPGLVMMAWLFLKEQGAPALVSRVGIDAASGKVTASEKAEVTAVQKKAGGVTFTVLEESLPFPVFNYARSILELLPIEKDLNQELLAVAGLAAGTYTLKIDGNDVGSYSAADLAAGISLGFNEKTPQYKQAIDVAKRTEQHRSAVLKWRDLLNSRRWMKNHYKIDVDDPAAVQKHYDHFEDKRSYSAIKALQYIKTWNKYDEYVKTSQDLEKELFTGRTPVPHVYEIVPSAGK